MPLVERYQLEGWPGKAYVEVDALSRKISVGGMASTFTTQKKLLLDMEQAGIEMSMEEVQSYLSNLTLEPTLLEQIRVDQLTKAELISIREEVGKGKQPDFNIAKDGTLKY
jgi:hypothetical protein